MLTTRIPGMSDALAFAGGRSFLRKMLLYQVNHSKALLVEADGAPVALVMFYSHRARLAEYAMVVKPEAARHMVALTRLAHLTLSRMAENGILVMAKVRETDARAQRMARLVGFGPGCMRDGSVWLYRRPTHEWDHRRLDGQGRREGQEGRCPGAGPDAGGASPADGGGGGSVERRADAP